MKTYKIHLIRHGLTAGNLEGRYIGRTDLPLCTQGEERLRRLMDGHAYPDAERLYAPALRRCLQTAAILYPGREVCPADAFSARCKQGFEAVLSDMMKSSVSSAAVVAPGGVLLSILAAFSIDRRPYSEWVTGDGEGYTVVVTPQLWMSDKVFEVRAPVPAPLPGGGEDGANDA